MSFLKPFFIGSITVSIFIYVVFQIYTKQESERWKNVKKIKTYGVVIRIDKALRGIDDAMVRFYDSDAKEYEKGVGRGVVNEKFKVIYNKSDPSDFKVMNDTPIFLKGEKTSFRVGKVKLFTILGQSVRYEYDVGDYTYEHSLFVSDSIKNYYSNTKKGDLFKVEYWKKDPRRSIIYLNEPINYIEDWYNYGIDQKGNLYELEEYKNK